MRQTWVHKVAWQKSSELSDYANGRARREASSELFISNGLSNSLHVKGVITDVHHALAHVDGLGQQGHIALIVNLNMRNMMMIVGCPQQMSPVSVSASPAPAPRPPPRCRARCRGSRPAPTADACRGCCRSRRGSTWGRRRATWWSPRSWSSSSVLARSATRYMSRVTCQWCDVLPCPRCGRAPSAAWCWPRRAGWRWAARCSPRGSYAAGPSTAAGNIFHI